MTLVMQRPLLHYSAILIGQATLLSCADNYATAVAQFATCCASLGHPQQCEAGLLRRAGVLTTLSCYDQQLHGGFNNDTPVWTLFSCAGPVLHSDRASPVMTLSCRGCLLLACIPGLLALPLVLDAQLHRIALLFWLPGGLRARGESHDSL